MDIRKEEMSKEDHDLRHLHHTTIKKVTGDIDQGYKFNTAISSLMILMNAMDKYFYDGTNEAKQWLLNEVIRDVVIMISPFAPHMGEELWEMMGHDDESVVRVPWPRHSEEALKQDTIQIVAQVNGKLRGRFSVPANSSEEAVKELVLADPKIQEFIRNKPLRRFIYVPGKLVNLVV